MERKLVIIDGSSLLYRAFYALPLLDYNGIPTNAVTGFLNMLYDIYRNFNPQYVAVSFDKSKHTFRSEMYKDYKATRKPAPDELVPQFDLIREALRVLGAAVYEMEGYEGDDILGTLAARYEKELPVLIVTGDRDALQLATEDTTVYLMKRGVTQMAEMTPSEIYDTYGITPAQVIDMKALMGDSSDNIPGVPGVGEKTAVKLLSQYSTLDEVYAHVDDIKGALGRKLKENKELAYLSYQLATIKKDVPIETSLHEMDRPVHYDEMETFFLHLGLKRIANKYDELSRFKTLAKEKKEETKAESWCVRPFEELEDKEDDILSLSLTVSGTAPFYHIESLMIGCDGCAYQVPEDCYEEAAKRLQKAKAVIVVDSKLIYETNFSSDHISFFDITLATYLIESSRTQYPLSYMAEVFGVTHIYPENLDTDEERLACICQFLAHLYAPVKERMEKEGVLALFETVEQPLVPVLARMEIAGIKTDEKEWSCVQKDMKEREDSIAKEIYEMVGEEFNINSPKQLSYILFEKMGMPVGKKTRNGYSTAADVLETLAEHYPVVKKILAYRTLSKLNSTYLEALPLLIRENTGRIHTSFNQTVTATGRLSSSDPNLQNIPVRTEEGRKIRSLFVPGDGYDCFISADYSQVELRVLAHMSGDESLIKAFLNKEDIHRRTAAEILGKSFDEVTAEERSHAKAVNFGIIYGISSFGLAKQLNISGEAAGDYIKKYLERYPHIHEFMEKMVEDAKETGRAVTLFGRYRALSDIRSSNYNRRSFAERTAMNTPIQGTAADIMKMAMIAVDKKMQEGHYQSRVLLQVHDELVVEATNDEKEAIKRLLKETMESVVKLRVPLIVDVNEGKNWAETK